jgi:hypothetical protein
MAVGVQVGSIVDTIGSASFFNAFFSTIVAVLEDDARGSRFPALTETLYDGSLSPAEAARARGELARVREGLSQHPPSAVVWDLDDRGARPPWGDDISADITSLGDYFVASSGRDLIDALDEALEAAVTENTRLEIVGL